MGKTDIVETIIGVGANLNLQAPSGETALMYASLIGHARIVKLLLRSGARLDLATIDSGFNALMIASSRGHADVVEILLEHVKKNRLDIALDMIDVAGNTALDHAANATPPEEEIAQMLVVAGITLGRRGAIFATPSILAAREKAMAERDARSS
jgi:ankyrin repeat protein